MNSILFKLNQSDLVKGAVVAALAVLVGALQQMLMAHGFHVLQYDWSKILELSAEAGVTYLLKNFLSDTQGRVLGRIG